MTHDRNEPVRVVLFDDNRLHSRWLAADLSDAGMNVVGVADNTTTMRRLVMTVQFDVAVLDVLVGPTDDYTGLRVALWLRRFMPAVGVLLYTNVDSEYCARRLLEAGAQGAGYLVKDRVQDPVHAIRRVHRGETAIDERIKRALLPLQDGKGPLGKLTPTEIQTLALVADGLTNEEIARRLGITVGAVNARCTSIFRKLGVEDPAGDGRNKRVAAVVLYLKYAEGPVGMTRTTPIDWPSPGDPPS